MPLDIKTVSEVFVELAVGHFNSTEALRELDKLKFTICNFLGGKLDYFSGLSTM